MDQDRFEELRKAQKKIRTGLRGILSSFGYELDEEELEDLIRKAFLGAVSDTLRKMLRQMMDPDGGESLL